MGSGSVSVVLVRPLVSAIGRVLRAERVLRAFKGWTGLTPLESRAQRRASPA